MLPPVHQMFALVRDLANGREVTEIPIARWYVLRHNLGPLASVAGAPRYRDEVVRVAVEWGRIERDLPPVVAAIENRGIRVATLKGVAYATSLYPRPTDRPMSDIDLLVDDRKAEAVLAELGFVRDVGAPFHHATTWLRGPTVIDLHHDFVASGRGQIDLDAVWARTTRGRFARRLDPVDELAFHLIHMARSRLCGPLVQIVDLHRLASRADIELGLARCRDWELGRGAQLAVDYYRSIMNGAPMLSFATLHDVLEAQQPSLPRRIAFELAVAGSPRQLAARAFAAVNQRLFAGRPRGDARGR